MDLRVKKTQSALYRALEELLREKSFDKITVKEICERAQTRTATFYQHFSDKYELFARMSQTKREDFSEISQQTFSNPQELIQYLIDLTLTATEEHFTFLQSVEENPFLQTIMINSTAPLKQKVHKQLEKLYPSDENTMDLDILTEMIIGSIAQLTHWWVEHRQTISKEEMLVRSEKILQTLLPPKK